MIPAICRTNLDDFRREEWPERFFCRPMVGDRVESKTGKILKIASIIHCKDKIEIELSY